LVTSTPPTQTINRADLTDIDLMLKLGHPTLMFDIACSIMLIHEYIRSIHAMQQHPHRHIFSSITHTPQTRNIARLNIHLGKIKANNNSRFNGLADHLANTVADRHPHDTVYLKGAQRHVSHWIWPYTTQPNNPNSSTTHVYTNLK
jgi:hypothetical protein